MLARPNAKVDKAPRMSATLNNRLEFDTAITLSPISRAALNCQSPHPPSPAHYPSISRRPHQPAASPSAAPVAVRCSDRLCCDAAGLLGVFIRNQTWG